MKPSSRYAPVRAIAAAILVGFGVCWGFQLITTVHGLLGDCNAPLYDTLIRGGYIVGLVAAGLWLYRRFRTLPVRGWEQAEFLFSAFFVAYICYLFASGEIHTFLAFTPDAAARRYAESNLAARFPTHGSIVFQNPQDRILRGTLDSVREYVVVDKIGNPVWAIGVYPRYLWWSDAYSMSFAEASPHK